MSKESNRSEFWEAIPSYVERAHGAARRIIGLAVSGDAPNVQLRATIPTGTGPDYKEHVSGRAFVAELWRSGEGMREFEADVPLDAARLAIHLEMGRSSPSVRVWQYRVSERPKTTVTDEEGPDWIGSEDRRHLGSLALPGYIFSEPDGFIFERPHILAYVYTSDDVSRGRHDFNNARGVGNMSSDELKDAIAPVCTPFDAQLLGQSVEAYHAAKIEGLLAVMERL